jgi:hypothetical protein
METPVMWAAPAVFGIVLILFGVLILVMPAILNYLIAAFFIMAGASLLGVAWGVRSRVTFHRMDETFRGRGPFDDG